MAKLWASEDNSVVVFNRGDGRSPYLAIKIKHPETKRWVYSSSQTAELEVAKHVALTRLGEINTLVKHGVETGSPNFSRAAKLFKDDCKTKFDSGEFTEQEYDAYVSEIDRFLLGYFKDKALNRISNKDIDAYREWRKNYWVTGPGVTDDDIVYKRAGKTVRTKFTRKKPASRRAMTQSMSLLNSIMKIAQDKKWLAAIPSTKLPKQKGPKRDLEPYFTLEEMPLLYKNMLDWIGNRERSIRKYHPKENERQLHELMYVRHLYVYMAIILGSGMRPGTEMENLKVRSFVLRKVTAEEQGVDHRLYTMDVDGKTGKRPAVLSSKSSLVADVWMQIELARIGEVKKDTAFFSTPVGPIEQEQTAGLFRRFLKLYGMTNDHKGRPRTLYALRRSYATNMIITRPNLSFPKLAHQMGTSVAMLDKHYVQPLAHVLNAREFVSGF